MKKGVGRSGQRDLQVQRHGGMREFTCLELRLTATSSQVWSQENEASGHGYSPEDVGRQVEPAPWFPENQARLTHHSSVSVPPSLLTLPRTKRLQDTPS